MSVVEQALVSLPAPAVLGAVFLLPALESSAFVGVVFPGEIAVVVGGVVAHYGGLPLAAVLVAAISGAILGDSVGYLVGRRYGHSLIRRLPERLVKPSHVEATMSALNRLGGRAVFVGRFTAALRALVPGMAGMAGMHYRTFLVWNVVGGAVWATGFVLLGYFAGSGYAAIEKRVSYGGLVLLGLVVVGIVVAVLRHRRHPAADH